MEISLENIVDETIKEQATILGERIFWSTGNSYTASQLNHAVVVKLIKMN